MCVERERERGNVFLLVHIWLETTEVEEYINYLVYDDENVIRNLVNTRGVVVTVLDFNIIVSRLQLYCQVRFRTNPFGEGDEASGSPAMCSILPLLFNNDGFSFKHPIKVDIVI